MGHRTRWELIVNSRNDDRGIFAHRPQTLSSQDAPSDISEKDVPDMPWPWVPITMRSASQVLAVSTILNPGLPDTSNNG